MLKTCAACPRVIPLGQARCDECRERKEREWRRTRGKTAVRGYDAAWRKLVRIAIATHPYCADCGHKGDRANPLTGDHIIPRAHGGQNTLSNIAVRCRVCNGRRGATVRKAKGPVFGGGSV